MVFDGTSLYHGNYFTQWNLTRIARKREKILIERRVWEPASFHWNYLADNKKWTNLSCLALFAAELTDSNLFCSRCCRHDWNRWSRRPILDDSASTADKKRATGDPQPAGKICRISWGRSRRTLPRSVPPRTGSWAASVAVLVLVLRADPSCGPAGCGGGTVGDGDGLFDTECSGHPLVRSCCYFYTPAYLKFKLTWIILIIRTICNDRLTIFKNVLATKLDYYTF